MQSIQRSCSVPLTQYIKHQYFWMQKTISRCLKIYIQIPVLGILSKEISADVVARIILANFLTNGAEYEQNIASH